jgi:hypothetical protein
MSDRVVVNGKCSAIHLLGDDRMSHICNDLSDKSADGLRMHRTKLSCPPGPLVTAWSPPHIRLDKVADALVNLLKLQLAGSIVPKKFRNCRQLNTYIWSEPGKPPIDCLTRDGLVEELGVSLHALVSQRQSKHGAVGQCLISRGGGGLGGLNPPSSKPRPPQLSQKKVVGG